MASLGIDGPRYKWNVQHLENHGEPIRPEFISYHNKNLPRQHSYLRKVFHLSRKSRSKRRRQRKDAAAKAKS